MIVCVTTPAFEARVDHARMMRRRGDSDAAIREMHGAIVLRELKERTTERYRQAERDEREDQE